MIIVGVAMAGEEGKGATTSNGMQEVVVAIAKTDVGGEVLGHVAEVGDGDTNCHGRDIGEE